MPFNLTILAEDESGTQLLYVIAVLILTIGGALFEKMKQKSAEAQRKQRPAVPPPSRPAVPPPVQQGGGTRLPPVDPPPWSKPERQVLRPMATPPPRPVARPQLPKPPRPRPQAAPEPVRPAVVQPVSRGDLGSGVQQAVSELERQVESIVDTRMGADRPTQSMAQMRGEKQVKAAPARGAVGFRKPTVVELQRAIVLNEVLGPPIGLRERQEF